MIDPKVLNELDDGSGDVTVNGVLYTRHGKEWMKVGEQEFELARHDPDGWWERYRKGRYASKPPAVRRREQFTGEQKAAPIVAREPMTKPEPSPEIEEAMAWLTAKWTENLDRGASQHPIQLHPFLVSVAGRAIEEKLGLTEKQAAAVLKFKANDEKPIRPVTPTAAAPRTQTPRVPDGHYAIEEDGELHFFKVNTPTTGKWAGFTFLQIQASDDYRAIKNRERKAAVLGAITADPKEAMARYGHEIGRCGVCNRTLTDPESIAIGIGPVCIEKAGF